MFPTEKADEFERPGSSPDHSFPSGLGMLEIQRKRQLEFGDDQAGNRLPKPRRTR